MSKNTFEKFARAANAVHKEDGTKLIDLHQVTRYIESLADILSGIISEEDIDLNKGIIHHKEGVDFIPGNVELSGVEMTLVSVTFRETILKGYIDQMRERYDYIIILLHLHATDTKGGDPVLSG